MNVVLFLSSYIERRATFDPTGLEVFNIRRHSSRKTTVTLTSNPNAYRVFQ